MKYTIKRDKKILYNTWVFIAKYLVRQLSLKSINNMELASTITISHSVKKPFGGTSLIFRTVHKI